MVRLHGTVTHGLQGWLLTALDPYNAPAELQTQPVANGDRAAALWSRNSKHRSQGRYHRAPLGISVQDFPLHSTLQPETQKCLTKHELGLTITSQIQVKLPPFYRWGN